MKRKQPEINESRRRMLGTSLQLGAVGIGLGALGVAVVDPQIAAKAPDKSAPSLGYRETEHILSYYRTAA